MVGEKAHSSLFSEHNLPKTRFIYGSFYIFKAISASALIPPDLFKDKGLHFYVLNIKLIGSLKSGLQSNFSLKCEQSCG